MSISRDAPGEARRSVRERVATAVGEPVAWLASFATHAAALMALGLLTAMTPLDRAPVLFSSPPLEEPEQLDPAFRVSEELSVDIGALSDGGAGDAAAAAPLEAVIPEVSLDLSAVTELGQLPTLDAPTPSLTSPDPNDNLIVRGVGAVGATGSRGAVDRLTGEILLSLDQRPTLVVWLFDRSGSLTKQREQILARFDRVYEELGVAIDAANPDADADDAQLLTAVAAFGADVEFLTPRPTSDVEAIKQAVRSISPDESGEENVFGAVVESVDRHKRFRQRKPRRNVMLVVLTDEAGDDIEQLDRAINLCRKMQTRVFVVGAPAPFGRRDAYVKYIDPDPKYDQTPQYLPVRQGPESLFPERLRLGYFGARDFDGPMLDSGFGPFGLTRLTAQTGGFYISVHPFRVDAGRADYARGRDQMASNLDFFFDERLMRRYRPDYVPVAEYMQRQRESRARQSLVAAAELSWDAPLERVRREFPKLEEAQFAQDLTRAQQVAAILEPKLQRLVGILQQGEADRAQLDSARWEAGFDLAMGRALAAKVRVEGYNAMLAMAKQGMEFSDPKNDTWLIAPADQIVTGSRAEAEAKRAKEYLGRVVAEHGGTPWALLAQQELDRPLGWQWRDAFKNRAEQLARQQSNRNRNPNRPAQPTPKPRRAPPKL